MKPSRSQEGEFTHPPLEFPLGLCDPSLPLSHPKAQATTDPLSVSRVCIFRRFISMQPSVGTLFTVVVLPIFISIIALRCIPVVFINSLFLFIVASRSLLWTHHQLLPISVDGHLAWS